MSPKLVLALTLMIAISTELVLGQYPATSASFYPERFCRGDRFGAELSYGCQTLPAWMRRNWDQVSFDTNGACVTLYDKPDCEGREFANFNRAGCRNIHAIGNAQSFRRCSGRTNSAFISG